MPDTKLRHGSLRNENCFHSCFVVASILLHSNQTESTISLISAAVCIETDQRYNGTEIICRCANNKSDKADGADKEEDETLDFMIRARRGKEEKDAGAQCSAAYEDEDDQKEGNHIA